ncbi:AAA family ATPase [Sphingobacterium litopenaei]|uniref:AAA family ATPase n=1 Tax=Sphingobacterium litopenaei TaxID=2763500 RepID=A0ABR7YGW6_9SPHI|nr:AAA family ATPase [Sphingobacterium litopenaei]MBD1430560.1 AAA family ATPase [Sphingobacterium litopenaei]
MIPFNQNIVEALEKSTVKITDEFKEPPIMITISNSDSVIGTLGNFSASTGKAKSRKTFNVISMVASALSGKQVLQYKVKVPPTRPVILYCDTEQSKFHCHRLLSRIYKLIDYPTSEVHDNLKFISLREYPTKQRINIIEYALFKYADRIGLVIIDGIRDLVYDINNATEATEITNKLMKWSQELNIHIHTVLHLNKGDDNTRGHLGTELNNKAESILQITKSDLDANYSTVAPKFIRDVEFEPFSFFIDDGIPVLDENFDLTSPKAKKGFSYQELSEENHREVLQELFNDSEITCTYDDFVARLKDAYLAKGFNFGINKSKQLKTFLENKRMIIKTDKTYRFNPEFYY